MNVNTFLKEYNSANDKEKFLKTILSTNYIPYTEKVTDCINIIKTTTEVDGIFKQNTPAQFMVFTTNLICKYTELEYEDNIVEFFEALDRENLINAIYSILPEREVTSYQTILSMCQDDYYNNNRELVSYIETKVAALQMTGDTLIEALNSFLSQNGETNEEG